MHIHLQKNLPVSFLPPKLRWQTFIRDESKLKKIDKGQTLFHTGRKSETLYLIKEGRLKLSIFSSTGNEHILAIHGKTDFIGMDFFNNTNYVSDAIALTNCELYAIDYTQLGLLSQLSDYSNFQQSIITILSHNNKQFSEHLSSYHFPLQIRLALFLLRQVNTYGVAIDRNWIEIKLMLNHSEIGNCINATRVSISTNMGILRDLELITGNRQIYQINLPRLTQFLNDYI